jgi:hypothetical protein
MIVILCNGGHQAKLPKLTRGKNHVNEQMMDTIMADGSVTLDEFTSLMKVMHIDFTNSSLRTCQIFFISPCQTNEASFWGWGRLLVLV